MPADREQGHKLARRLPRRGAAEPGGKVQETYGSVQDNAEKPVSEVEERGKQ